MKQIKIVYAITKGNWGGAQKYVYDLATHLSREKFAISVISGQPGRLCDKLKTQNIPVFTLDSLGRDINVSGDWRSFWALLKILRANKPDILHLNSPKMGLLGAIAGRLAGVKKIIYTSHGWPFLEDRNGFSKLFFKILCWKITWLCHETITISQSERTNKKFHLIYNGIENIDFLPRAEARKKLTLPESDLIIGTIAELHQNKGLEFINFPCVVIGEGEERENLTKNKNLKLLGHIPEAAKYLKAFDLFVLPSVKEGLPYVLLEAGLAGLPVIATRVGGIAEIIENEVSGLLVEARNREQLAQALDYLIKNPNERKIFGENLQETVREKFSLKKMVAETRGVYGE